MKTHQQLKQRPWSLYVVLLLTVVGGLTACRDNALNDLDPADTPVYITNYDRSVDFAQFKTFSLTDSVVIQSNNQFSTSLTTTENQFVTAVANGLTARGFQRVARGTSADLGVAVIRVNDRYTNLGVYSPYYSNYWGGFGGYGGYRYSPYFPAYFTYETTDQYWEIQIVDLKTRPVQTGTDTNVIKLNVLYNATVRGTGIYDRANVDAAVSAIIGQSLYLRTSR